MNKTTMDNYTDQKAKENSVFGTTSRRVRDIMNFDAPPPKNAPHYQGRHTRSTFGESQREYETIQENRTGAQTTFFTSAMTTMRNDTRRSSHQDSNMNDLLTTGKKRNPFQPAFLNNVETIMQKK